MATATMKPIQTQRIEPAIERDTNEQNPTATRYGWCPFGDINLVGPDGIPSLYVQPVTIDGPSGVIENPYHRVLPKGQLIPFPTFNLIEQQPSAEAKDSNGRALLESVARTITALEAIVQVLRGYSGWGFTILQSLQAVDQDMAMRIFQVVHPFEYPIARLEYELTAGADERIDAVAPITFEEFPGYVVAPLTTDYERSIARALAAEMANGAEIAAKLADDTLNDTETSMTTRFAGGNGKTGPDNLDRRLSAEMERELPKLVGNKQPNSELAEMKEQMNFLVGREASRADKEKIAELEAKIAKYESQETPVAAGQATCGRLKSDNTPCGTVTGGGPCKWHMTEEEKAAA